MPMDEYYSELNVPEDSDDNTLFTEHVVRDTPDLEHIDKMLNSLFTDI